MKKILFLLFLVTISSSKIFAQRPNSFSFDVGQFINDLYDWINKNGNTEARNAVQEFEGNYNAGKFSNTQKLYIIRMCNDMLTHNYNISPDFENYLKAMNGIAASNQTAKFDNWQKALTNSMNISKEAFTKFLVVSRNIYGDHVISQTGFMRWVTSNSDVDMQVKGEPAFIFKKLDMFCYTPGDTVEIYGTSGKYFPATNSWQGKDGKCDFTRVGLDSAQIYVILKNYRIDFQTGNLNADTALFYNTKLFSQPIPGKYYDKPMGQSMGAKSPYPQFESQRKNYTGLTFGKGKFTGGFGMKGATITCKGVDSMPAQLVFLFKEKPALKVQAQEMVIRANKVSTLKAAITIYLDKDSIYHPQLEFNYRIGDHYIILARTDDGISQSPFLDSYHNVEFYCDELKWDLNNPKIDIVMINDKEAARFESVNHFRDHRYEELEFMLSYNPLARIKIYCEKYHLTGFDIDMYAKAFNSIPGEIKLQMIELHAKGFVTYDPKTEYVRVNRKLIDYVNAHNGRTDY
ncbi:MAG: hypothetical protein ACHQK8_09235, partial [Bacteroidia bacterium]